MASEVSLRNEHLGGAWCRDEGQDWGGLVPGWAGAAPIVGHMWLRQTSVGLSVVWSARLWLNSPAYCSACSHSARIALWVMLW